MAQPVVVADLVAAPAIIAELPVVMPVAALHPAGLAFTAVISKAEAAVGVVVVAPTIVVTTTPAVVADWVI
jgi:hypothetical protein